MQIGSRKVTDDTTFQKRIRVRDMKDGEQLVVRIVNGPSHRWFHMWPTLEEDPVAKTLKNSWRSVYVRKDDTTNIEKLATADKLIKTAKIKAAGGDEKTARSLLSKQNRYDYAVIRRGAPVGQPIIIEVAEANWRVYSSICTLFSEKDPRNPNMLLKGLPYMSDICITKGTDQKTHRPSYAVSVIGCQVEGKIELKYLDEVACPYPSQEQFFTSVELEAIKNSPWDLDTIDVPKTPEEVSAMIGQFPIDFGRREKNDQSKFYLFSTTEELKILTTVADSANVMYYLPSQEDLSAPAIAAPAQTAVTQPVQIQSIVVTQPVQQAPPVQPIVQTVVQPMVAEKVAPVLPSQPSSQNTGQPMGPAMPPNGATAERKRPKW